MDFSIMTDLARRAVYVPAWRAAPQADKAAAPVSARDTVSISAEARQAAESGAVSGDTGEPDAGTAFTSFAGEFDKVLREYAGTVREHYAEKHAENLTYPDPGAHIWDKYKNPDSPHFRSDMSEDERAWAYDQELDLLNGGRHLQMGNPYVFPDGAPTLASAAAKANQACREQIDQSIQDLFKQNGIEIPADASFRLTVDDSYTFHVTGLEDKELTEAMEQALNCGDNGKNLYDHLKLTAPDGETPGVDYANGHLSAAGPLSDGALDEVKRQTCPAYSQFSDAYDPHKEPMGVIAGLDGTAPDRESAGRFSAAVRTGMPEIIARLNAGEFGNQPLEINRYAMVDPDGSIRMQTYFHTYAERAMTARRTVEDYYAAAHRENSSYPFSEALDHIAQKYKWPDSDIFRSDLSERQRDMYYRQERALLTGARVTLLDPYALASIGGVQNLEDEHKAAMQAVKEKMDALWAEMYGAEV